MPVSSSDLEILGKSSLDDYLRNTAVDQISTDTPLLKKLMQKKKKLVGAKQNVTVNIRKSLDSNLHGRMVKRLYRSTSAIRWNTLLSPGAVPWTVFTSPTIRCLPMAFVSRKARAVHTNWNQMNASS